MTKAELRKEMKLKEADFIASGRCFEESERIFSAVSASPEFKAAGTVLLYMSIRGEVVTDAFIDYCRSIGKRVAIPLVEGSELSLKVYDKASLVSGYKGILEPSSDAPNIAPQCVDLAIIPGIAFARHHTQSSRHSEPSLTIGDAPVIASDSVEIPPINESPVIASDSVEISPINESLVIASDGVEISSNSGYMRLGRGGGFYDRLLPSLNCPIFAVAYPFRVMEQIPYDPWDKPIDRLFY